MSILASRVCSYLVKTLFIISEPYNLRVRSLTGLYKANWRQKNGAKSTPTIQQLTLF